MTTVKLEDDYLTYSNSTRLTGTADGHVTFTANAGNTRISGVANPTSAQDAATKDYVDSATGSSPSAPTNSVQFNNSGSFGGSANFTFDGTNTVAINNTLENIEGNTLTVQTVDRTASGAGDNLNILAGNANTSGVGGDINITAGDGVSAAGGDIFLNPGSGSTVGIIGINNAASTGDVRIGGATLSIGNNDVSIVNIANSNTQTSNVSIMSGSGPSGNVNVMTGTLPTGNFNVGAASMNVSTSIIQSNEKIPVFSIQSTDGYLTDVNNLVSQGDYLYVSGSFASNYDVTIYNIKNGIEQVNGATGDGTASFSDLKIQGNYLYSVRSNNIIKIIDVSSKRVPSILSQLTLTSVQRISVNGSYLYAVCDSGTGTDAFKVVDITDPNNPIEVSSLTDGTNLLNTRYIDVQGTYAYVHCFNATAASNRFTIIDITDPVNPSVAGSVASANLDTAKGLVVSGTYAYLPLDGAKFTVVNITDPTVPAVISSLTVTGVTQLEDIFVSGPYAYVVSADDDSLVVIDITNPTSPSQEATLADGTNLNGVQSITLNGRFAYCGSAAGTPQLSKINIHGSQIVAMDAGTIKAENIDVTKGVDVAGPASFNSGVQMNNSLAVLSSLSVNGNSNLGGDSVLASSVNVLDAATTSNIANLSSVTSVDNYVLSDNDLVLVKDQEVATTSWASAAEGSGTFLDVIGDYEYSASNFRFVSVQSASRPRYSDAGTSWTDFTGSTLASYGAAGAGDTGNLVVVGSGILYASSATALSTASGSTTPGTGTWTGIAYSPSLTRWVVVSNATGVTTNQIGYTDTDDGSTGWTTIDSPANLGWIDVAWSPKLGMFAAVTQSTTSSSQKVMTSTTGTSFWTQRTTPTTTERFFRISWSDTFEMFIANAYNFVSNNGSTGMGSYDGINWFWLSATGWENLNETARGNLSIPGMTLFCSPDATTDIVKYTLDGREWKNLNNQPPSTTNWRQLAYNSPNLVIVGDGGSQNVYHCDLTTTFGNGIYKYNLGSTTLSRHPVFSSGNNASGNKFRIKNGQMNQGTEWTEISNGSTYGNSFLNYQLTSTKSSIVAFVSQTSTSTTPIITNVFNVSHVERTGTGIYRVYFSSEIPSNSVIAATRTTGGAVVVTADILDVTYADVYTRDSSFALANGVFDVIIVTRN